ncbi:hypothetical protein PV417_30845 [Streptomyces sp. ME19-03-3]|nr:hypothetical protein [Streptomyces sp. ME19-03-3]
MSEIIRLEHTGNHLRGPGDVIAATGLWRDHVHQPERDLRHDDEWGDVRGNCCGWTPVRPEPSSFESPSAGQTLWGILRHLSTTWTDGEEQGEQ